MSTQPPTAPPDLADPWAWSLDSTLTAAGVGVAFLGALATALIAGFALAQTKHANRLEAEARARAARAEFARAVDKYLTTVPPFNRLPQSITIPAMQDLHAAAAGVGSDAESIPGWIHSTVLEEERRDAARRKGPPDPHWTEHSPKATVAFIIQIGIRHRLTRWVASGQLDRSRLFPDAPSDPDCVAR